MSNTKNIAVPTARFFRLPEVMQRTGLSRTTIYQMIKDGKFPRPARISTRASGWAESELLAWNAAKMAERTPVQAAA